MDSENFKERPRICLIDTPMTVDQRLSDAGFNVTKGTFGPVVKLPERQREESYRSLLNSFIPQNLHEFDVITIDLLDRDIVDYDVKDHQRGLFKGGKDFYIACKPPRTLFDPRPYTANLLGSQLKKISRDKILLIFTNREDYLDYELVFDFSDKYVKPKVVTHSNYEFIPRRPARKYRQGFDTQVDISIQGDLQRLLSRYNDEFEYHIAFENATVWSREINSRIKDLNFFPLIRNPLGEIVSYLHLLDNTLVYVFPQLDSQSKSTFLNELLDEYLPDVRPEFFPNSTKFSWLQDPEYYLPNEHKFRKTQELIKKDYKAKLDDLNTEITENKKEFGFLHELLTLTGEGLVSSVEEFLSWLGFENVVNVDESTNGIKEEDLRIEFGEGLLVIEVKGISGTSTDSQCAQINKIKYRRAKERKRFDVFGLYIVNHQRHLPPEKRQNPPFTENQIRDAINEERGLVTTYQMFKLFFAVEQGFIKKEDARNSMLKNGLVTFSPSSTISLGMPLEIHYGGKVGIINISNTRIHVGMKLLNEQDGRYQTVTIEGLRLDDEAVEEASNGEVGIKFDKSIKKNSNLWMREKDPDS